MSQPIPPGSRVRVEYEGVWVVGDHDRIYIGIGGSFFAHHTIPSGAVVTVLEPARPEWWPPQKDDIALDANGALIEYWHDAWSYVTGGVAIPAEPLELLVRGGKRWAGRSSG